MTNNEKVKVHLSLGSNIGDREEYLASALRLLKVLPETELIAVSDIYLADPVGENLHGHFLNIAVCIKSSLPLYEIQKGLREIEHILGKAKTLINGDRTIDIDIIFAGDFRGNYNDLKIPHPDYHVRDFVLMPLSDILETLTGWQSDDVRKHLARDKSPDAPLCLKYKKMVY